MNKRIDLSNLGGFPLEQDSLQFMQESYRGAFAAIAQLCGNKTILYGVESVGGNITDGWIAYNGELIPFIGGVAAADVVITETPAAAQATFEDGTDRDVYFTKVATVGAVGDFPFTDLVPLLSLQNTWLSGDLKQKHVDNAYIAANFDGSGYGLNKEKGWRILSAAYPDAAGRVLVNRNPADADFDEVGKLKGAKTHTLTMPELPAKNILGVDEGTAVPAGGGGMIKKSSVGASTTTVNVDSLGSGTQPDILNIYSYPNLGTDTPHNNIQPSYVVLTLIKL